METERKIMPKAKTLETRFEDFERIEPVCPHCGSNERVIRYGARTVGGERVQLHFCRKCESKFSTRAVANASYSPKIILASLTYFNMGHSLEETVRTMNRTFKKRIPRTTVHSWVRRYGDQLPFTRIRRNRALDPASLIRTRRLFHPQPYLFRTHMMKLAVKTREAPSLRNYVLSMMDDPMDYIFQSGNVDRCSALARTLKCPSKPSPERDQKTSNLASWGEQLARTASDRHRAVEEFFLANDAETVAVELPVYMTVEELRARGFDAKRPLTGHIDIVRANSGIVHLMDYKPDAAAAHDAPSQLSVYAMALGQRTKIPKERIRCSYFDGRSCIGVEPGLC